MSSPHDPSHGQGRVRRSWRLIAVAWSVVRGDRTMAGLFGISTLTTSVGMVAIFGFSGFLTDPEPARSRIALAALVAAYPLTFAAVFCNVAVAAAADAALHGRRLSLREALAVSRGKLGQIALWSLLVAGVGALLSNLAERLPAGGRIAAWALGGAWGLLTVFAVPVLAVEGCNAPTCVRRSASLLRDRWGEGVAGTVVILSAVVVVSLPAGLVLGLGAGMLSWSPVIGAVLMALGALTLAAVAGATGVLREVFAVALYRYAVDGIALGGFSEADLQAPFTKRRRGRRGGSRRER